MHRRVATLFGSGLIIGKLRGNDSGSGTLGALFAGVIAFFLFQTIELPLQILTAGIVVGLSIWSVRPLVPITGDAGWIVIDEAAGAFVALIGLGEWQGAVVAFLVFRAADIFKGFFPGVLSAERVDGAVGVTADDVVAGLYGLVAGHLVQSLV